MKTLAETDLCHPIRDYLVAQGYTVRSEVSHCDITAVKGDDLVIIEIKRRFGISLLIQATQRQKITDSVYVALPQPRPSKRWERIQHLLRRLALGLILVSLRPPKPKVEVVFHPLPFDRKKRKGKKVAVLREIAGRSGDFNDGGSFRRPLVTAYRENAIHIACCLETLGPLSPRQLRALGAAPNTTSILYHDHYGWFERIARATYDLRPRGRAELALYPHVARRYRAQIRKRENLRLPIAGSRTSRSDASTLVRRTDEAADHPPPKLPGTGRRRLTPT